MEGYGLSESTSGIVISHPEDYTAGGWWLAQVASAGATVQYSRYCKQVMSPVQGGLCRVAATDRSGGRVVVQRGAAASACLACTCAECIVLGVLTAMLPH
eukprot:1162105-Pelagomonas_calceolata.AAC.6